MKFSEEQLKVINTENKNILVSAAAGSGKTAVLVERIIRKITDVTNPIDIDTILVMTFTNAAAAEMRDRIEKAVNAKLNEELIKGDNEELISHLKKQASLVRKAYISTIDSFCKELIKNNFSQIGLDPSFRIAEEAELTLLKADVMAELLEKAYEEENEEFLDFVENFSVKKSDSDIEKAIESLYKYSQSKPNPEKWLEECDSLYYYDTADELFSSEFIKEYMNSIFDQLNSMAKETMVDITISEKPGGPYKYIESLQNDLEKINRLCEINDYDFLVREIENIEFDRLGTITKKDSDIDEGLKELVKANRDKRKVKIKSIFNNTLAKTKQGVFEDISSTRTIVTTLAKLSGEFLRRFDEAKRELQILDFSDLEHLALRILYDDRMEKPSDIAIAYRNKFNEIMVDEYQDSNEVQEYLVNSIARKNNVFTVGDVKQSIYKFRLAKPELFIEKMNSYSTEQSYKNKNESPNNEILKDDLTKGYSVRIDLHNNFRSSNTVLDAANFVFKKIMHTSVGMVEYDEDAMLNHGRLADDCEGSEAELLLIEPIGEKDEIETEAIAVCHKIEDLLKNYMITDKESGQKRHLRYSDITILLRTRSGWEDIFSKVLSEYDIPNHSEKDTGYFSSYEIRNIIDYLRLINNPLNDEVLASVMLGPFGGFDDSQLSQIRIYSKKGCFYQSIEEYQLKDDDKDLVYIKLCEFYENLNYFRKIVPYTPVHELIEKIISKFNYDLLVKSMKNGQKRYMNLSALLVRAKDFEKTSFKGLFDFIRYIEKIRNFDIDYGELDTIAENDDCVRIMSIHKSKGLEFPVTFISGCAKNYNEMDVNASIVMDDENGIGINYIDSVNRTKATTLIKEAIRFKQKKDLYGEELRVLYVAMTRAREKTIITGVINNDDLNFYLNKDAVNELSMSDILNCNSYLKLILPSCINDKNSPIVVKRLEASDIMNRIEQDMTDADSAGGDVDFSDDCGALVSEELKLTDKQMVYINQLKSNFEYSYPYNIDKDVPMKLSVSAIKHMDMEEKAAEDRYESIPKFDAVDEAKVPYFISGQKRQELIGALRGTAYHRFFELLPFNECYVNRNDNGKTASYVNITNDELSSRIAEEKSEFVEKSLITQDEVDCIDVSDIIKFMSTNLYERMVRANADGLLFKEQPFTYLLKASEVEDDYPEDEDIIVQGIIDAFFYEGDDIVIMDYKTDKVKSGRELVDRYEKQLELYAQALEQITGKKVKECIIYSVTLGECIDCN